MDYTLLSFVPFLASFGVVAAIALALRRRLSVTIQSLHGVMKEHEECRRKLDAAEERLRSLEQISREYEQVVREMIRTL